jgi:uncharacterized protein (DUF58 family)
MTAAARLIAPATLARLANLELLARTVVEGALIGVHRSPRFGFSQEFAEYRPYAAGDDPRFIDWNVFARSDRTYVKRFFGDTNARINVLVDTSASMGVAAEDSGVRKLDYARYLAAALVYLARRQHDAVGLAAFADAVYLQRPPSARPRAAETLYHLLDGLEAGGRTNFAELLAHAAARLGKRALVVLISDLYCQPDEFGKGLRSLAAGGHDLLVLHVLDPAEREPTLGDAAAFRDVETGEVVDVAAEDLSGGYPERLTAHLGALETAVRSAAGHYRLMYTDAPLDRALGDYLRFRERHP